MNKTFVAVAAFATTLASASGAFAVGPPYCGTYATPDITAPTGKESSKCQSTIAKEVAKYVKTMVKTRGKCITSGDYSACPSAKDDEKVQKAGIKAAEKIAKKCNGFVGGLGSSYSTFPDAQVGSCSTSQANGTAEVYVGETHGIGYPTTDSSAANEARNDCQSAINKAAQKHLPSVLKAMNKCLDKAIKAGTTTGLGELCVGSLLPGGLTPPTDSSTAEAITKANDKVTKTLAKACTGLPAQDISDLYGCPGATSEADLQACVECSALNASFEIVGQQYAETATLIEPGAGAIQAAVDAGSAGDRFLIASGEYDEGIVLPGATCVTGGDSCTDDSECGICAVSGGNCGDDLDCTSEICDGASDNPGDPCTDDVDCPNGTCIADPGDTCTPMPANECVSDGDDMAFIGCGAATDDRPRVIPPLIGAPSRGFTAVGVDGLHFGALEITGWTNDGIFVSNAVGVSFRDLFGDGDDLSTPELDSVSTYAIFPVDSSGVVVEGCEVVNVRDAGIYVGSSVDIVTRHNLCYDNVTGIEIENSEFADVYGNYTYDNTGGLLSFKLSGPAKQDSGDHNFFDNISYRNNTPNFGIPGTTVGSVIPGTGVMIISEDDSTFENNRVEDNDTFGFVILDQEIINVLVGPPPLFDPTSPDQDSENLRFVNNRLPVQAPSTLWNGSNSQSGLGKPSGNWVFALATETNGTCWTGTPVTPRVAIHNGPGDDFPTCP